MSPKATERGAGVAKPQVLTEELYVLARQRDNPSVSLTADSPLYTRGPFLPLRIFLYFLAKTCYYPFITTILSESCEEDHDEGIQGS